MLILVLVTLTACAASAPLPAAPGALSTPSALPPTAEVAPAGRVVLAAGRYQLIMFYSPI